MDTIETSTENLLPRVCILPLSDLKEGGEISQKNADFKETILIYNNIPMPDFNADRRRSSFATCSRSSEVQHHKPKRVLHSALNLFFIRFVVFVIFVIFVFCMFKFYNEFA